MLLAKKIGMTQTYDDEGVLLPVTVIQAGPCTVMQVKKTAIDGYNAVQLGYDDVRAMQLLRTLLFYLLNLFSYFNIIINFFFSKFYFGFF